jgi:hypothetical protein
VLVWEPPHRVRFTWHPARDPSTAQEVGIEFLPEGSGTAAPDGRWMGGWGRGAARARRGYRVGWGYVLNVWAGRRTLGMSLLDGVAAGIDVVQKLRGGVDAEIARAGGEISR